MVDENDLLVIRLLRSAGTTLAKAVSKKILARPPQKREGGGGGGGGGRGRALRPGPNCSADRNARRTAPPFLVATPPPAPTPPKTSETAFLTKRVATYLRDIAHRPHHGRLTTDSCLRSAVRLALDLHNADYDHSLLHICVFCLLAHIAFILFKTNAALSNTIKSRKSFQNCSKVLISSL